MEGDDTPARSKAVTPMTEEQLLAVTVGERLPLNSTIHIASYDPAWPSLFAREAKQIRDILGDKVLLLEHVGSTSVPGLPAKPIIDMVLAVADSDDEASYVLPLETQAYALRVREPDWFRHRLLGALALDHPWRFECPHAAKTGPSSRVDAARYVGFHRWLPL